MECFPDRDAQATAAADLLAESLRTRGPKSLVVTGGGSPGPVYDRLSAIHLDWAGITVTLSDDRWVDPSAEESNDRLVRERLLVGPAALARFVPLKCKGPSPDADALKVEPSLRGLLPFSACLLGMGEDGHIASLFPADPDLATRLDPDGARLCVGVAMSGLAPFLPRISLTVGALLASRLLVLLIIGEAKKALVERVRGDPGFSPPVAAILRQARVPVRVLWAP